jgi:hypothetical protein
MSNSGSAGYVAGGFVSGGLSGIIEKFAFPSDTRSSLSSNMATARRILIGSANNGVAGYLGGGFISGASNIISKMPFGTETDANLGAVLNTGRYGLGAMADSGSN